VFAPPSIGHSTLFKGEAALNLGLYTKVAAKMANKYTKIRNSSMQLTLFRRLPGLTVQQPTRGG
jgi:hypothetical protein